MFITPLSIAEYILAPGGLGYHQALLSSSACCRSLPPHLRFSFNVASMGWSNLLLPVLREDLLFLRLVRRFAAVPGIFPLQHARGALAWELVYPIPAADGLLSTQRSYAPL